MEGSSSRVDPRVSGNAAPNPIKIRAPKTVKRACQRDDCKQSSEKNRNAHFHPLMAKTCMKHAPTTIAEPASCGHFRPHLSPAQLDGKKPMR